LSQFATILIRITLLITFAIWWGGFTFYAAIVVPVGSEILGSARTQGFITQVVTHWLNLAAALTILMMAVDSWLNRRTPQKGRILHPAGSNHCIFHLPSRLGLPPPKNG
jgi:hypothetical protein